MQATLAVHHFDPLKETATMRATPDRGLEVGFTEKCERPAGWPLSVVRHRHACACAPIAPTPMRVQQLGRRARSLAREFGGGGALTQT